MFLLTAGSRQFSPEVQNVLGMCFACVRLIYAPHAAAAVGVLNRKTHVGDRISFGSVKTVVV